MRWLERLLRYRRRSLTFTSLGVRFVLVTLAVGLAAINTGNNLLYLVLALLLSLITLSGILSEQCLRRLAVVRRLAPTIFASEPASVSLVATNHKRLFPSFLLHLSEVTGAGRVITDGADLPIFVLPPGATRSMTLRLTFARRGLHQLHSAVASTKFPFGLFTKQLTIPLADDVLVFPVLLPHDALAGLINPVGQELARARRGQGSGFFILRDYRDGDDARMIHWKSSARQSKLLVREADEEEHRELTLVLDRRWPADGASERAAALYHARFERAVSLAATLAVEWARRGWRLGLIADGVHVAPAHGRAHLARVLRTLALVPPIQAPASHRGMLDELRAWAAEPPPDHEVMAPSHMLRQRRPDDVWIALLLWDDAEWPAGLPNLLRRVVVCPNEPASIQREEG